MPYASTKDALGWTKDHFNKVEMLYVMSSNEQNVNFKRLEFHKKIVLIFRKSILACWHITCEVSSPRQGLKKGCSFI